MRQSIATQVIRESRVDEVDTESGATDRYLARQQALVLDEIAAAAAGGQAEVVLDKAISLDLIRKERLALANA